MEDLKSILELGATVGLPPGIIILLYYLNKLVNRVRSLEIQQGINKERLARLEREEIKNVGYLHEDK